VRRSLVVLSGGLDSTFNLAVAAQSGEAIFALSFNYGQRAASAELKAAETLAKHYHVQWKSIAIEWLGEVNPTALTRPQMDMPDLAIGELDHPTLTEQSKRAVWVANRNGVFLNIAAAYAEALGCDTVLAGFNKEEASTFPDNSVDFMRALEKAFSFSTQNQVKVDSYCKDFDKTQILARAISMDIPLQHVWSCYQAGPQRCWKCESCRRTERALLAQGNAGAVWLKQLGH
jgi:7-cyano-7-deazaguanine synthase